MHSLIREALGIGQAPWPPDYLTLLGLAPHEATPERVELAVLDRMERLRAYQLAHPDEVTEAMNLLARALDALSAAPPAADQAENPITPAYDVAPPETIAPVIRLIHPQRAPRQRIITSTARERVRLLVGARRMLEAWDGIGAYLTEKSPAPPTRFALVQVIVRMREAAQLEPDELPAETAGGAVLALARSRVTTQLLMELPETRRDALADDWRAGRWRLLEQYDRARANVGRRSLGRSLNRRWRRHARRAPEIAAIGIAAIAVMIAVWRWMR